MKRAYLLTVLFLMGIFSLTLVSAQYSVIDQLVDNMKQASVSIFGPILGYDQIDDFLFAKILLFLLIFSIVFMVLKRINIFEDNKAVQVVVSTIVGIFSVRYLEPTELITAILLPYGALGASITVLLPLLIYFMFVHTSIDGGFGRRFAWFLYGLIMIFLWFTRGADLGTANWIYFASLIFVLLNLFFDKSIHSYFMGWEAEASSRNYRELSKVHIKNEMKEVADAWKNQLISKADYDRLMNDLKKRYKGL